MADRKSGEKGATAIQVLVVLVPVFFGFMGFAIDLGRLYLSRGEIKSAASAMALAAASRLIGTDASAGNATTAARLAIDNTGGFGNKYDFGTIVIGEGSGRLTSAVPEPTYYDSVGAATGSGNGGGEASSGGARHVRIDIRTDAPLIFWGFLSLGQERKTQVAARAVAGISAPLCTACGIEPIALAPIDAADTTNFGFTQNQRYTLGYLCTGGNQPSGLAGATQRVPYLLLNRYNDAATLFPDETAQLYRIGAGGLPGDTDRARACIQVTNSESVWATATPAACTVRVSQSTTAFTCGLASRFDSAVATGCEAIASAGDIITAYTPDPDITDLDDYAAYTGNIRRILTVAIVDSLSAVDAMTVLGFRQFLIQPDQSNVNLSPVDSNGRFVVSYLGSPVPLKQGFLGGCSITSGPGKVVLHQ
ncbi:MAG: hypothetical protein H7Y20_19600 [Bryobacteraceae bacterium]|nr:hypothetical protein [Bryobacteraceae bacterium]